MDALARRAMRTLHPPQRAPRRDRYADVVGATILNAIGLRTQIPHPWEPRHRYSCLTLADTGSVVNHESGRLPVVGVSGGRKDRDNGNDFMRLRHALEGNGVAGERPIAATEGRRRMAHLLRAVRRRCARRDRSPAPPRVVLEQARCHGYARAGVLHLRALLGGGGRGPVGRREPRPIG